jgi:alkanesulfonate monooxygenase SsuD/methylene tetrahydromethanopterin reductase-like flavin-dependent oxidoreductase (luciferase family)
VLDHFDGTVLPLGDRDMLECCTLVGALAASTTSIGIGTLVANVANRHPAVLAAAMSSAQRISAGRLRVGIGAGASPNSPWAREHHDRGIPLLPTLAQRHLAVIRQIEVLRTLEPMPIIVGVNSIELAEIAGIHADGANVRLRSADARAQIDAARAAAGDRRFEASGWAGVDDDAGRAEAEALGLDRLILVDLGPLA